MVFIVSKKCFIFQKRFEICNLWTTKRVCRCGSRRRAEVAAWEGVCVRWPACCRPRWSRRRRPPPFLKRRRPWWRGPQRLPNPPRRRCPPRRCALCCRSRCARESGRSTPCSINPLCPLRCPSKRDLPWSVNATSYFSCVKEKAFFVCKIIGSVGMICVIVHY